MKNEVSKKNPYWIPKYRYLELKNWLKQYPMWVDKMDAIFSLHSKNSSAIIRSTNISDPTSYSAIELEKYDKNIRLLEELCTQIFPENPTLFKMSLIEEIPYDIFEFCPVSRAEWYKRRRAFFYWLDKRRD